MPKSSNKEEYFSGTPLAIIAKNTPSNFSFKSFLGRLLGRTSNTIKQLTSSQQFSREAKDVFGNFVQLGSKTLEDVMISRSCISAVKHDISLDDLNQVIIKLPHTRTLVYEDTLDHIIGFVDIKDIFKVIAQKQPFQLSKLIRKPIISAPSMRVIALLHEMQKQSIPIAVVVDEYGGTDGIVTFKDIAGQVLGRIDAQLDEIFFDANYQILDSSTMLLSSRVKIEDLEAILHLKLRNDNDEFDTVGGLVLARAGRVPLPGAIIAIDDDIELEVIDATPRTLKKVQLKIKNAKYFLTKTPT